MVQDLRNAFLRYDAISPTCGVLLKRFQMREPVHAYLLTGARGLGKRTFAKTLASALFCTSANKPCGACDECERFYGGNNPDVLTVFADDGKSIGVDRVREVIRTVSQHAFGENSWRVVMIEPVEKMTLQAQNCLLKSLEEPMINVVFLLMTHELSATLGTIASRCLRVKMPPWSDDVLTEALEKHGHTRDEIAGVLPRCGGNIGLALSMLTASDVEANAFAKAALAVTGDAAAVGLSTKMKEGRDSADQSLNALEQMIYQALLVRLGRLDISALADYPPLWRKAALYAPVSDFSELLGAVFETRKLKAGQVNWQSNIDHLMMKLLEEHQKWQQSLA